MNTRHLVEPDLKYKEGTDLYRLCFDLETESRNGAINFKSPFYSKVCKILELNYNKLSSLGKMRLKCDAINTVTHSFAGEDFFHQKDYYI